jgi:hypothetical protein
LGEGFAIGEQGDCGAGEDGSAGVAEKQTPAGNNEAGLAHDFPPRKLRFNESLTSAKADAPGGLWYLGGFEMVTHRFDVH